MDYLLHPYRMGSILKYKVLEDESCSIIDIIGHYDQPAFIFPGEIDSHPVVHIENRALTALSGIKKVTIPSTVMRLGDYIGEEPDLILSSIKFPETLESITVDKANKAFCSVKGILYSRNKDILYYCPRQIDRSGIKTDACTRRIFRKAFAGCLNIRTVTILADVVEEKAFESCKHLESVICDVSKIEDKAFSDCENLKEVVMGNQLRYIGDYAFANCTKLSAVHTDTDRLQRMVTNSFFNCTSLKTIFIPEGSDFVSIEDVVFRKTNPDNIFNEDVPVGMYSLVLYPSKRKAETYVLPMNAYAIEDGAFSNLFYDLQVYMPSYCVSNIDLMDSTGPSNIGYLVGDVWNYPNWKIGIERHWIDK